jgi:hypothetical protein
VLSLIRLSNAGSAVTEVKNVASQASDHLKAATDAAMTAAAAGSGDLTSVAHATTQAASSLGDLSDAAGSVDDALKQLTGRLAPARVCFAIASLLIVSALVAFGIITISST